MSWKFKFKTSVSFNMRLFESIQENATCILLKYIYIKSKKYIYLIFSKSPHLIIFAK